MATPPVSYGYPGSINAAALATWLPAAAAARFSVVGADDWRVSVLGGLDRGLQVNAGTGCGDGVMDVTAEYETMSLPLVGSGSQWFLVVRRRNWAAPPSTNLVAIPGTSEKKLPARSDNPGFESDQPLALCRVQAGQTIVQEIVDLRCWGGNGGLVAADAMALDYLARPGADVRVGPVSYRYALAADGTWGWYSDQPLSLAPLQVSGYAISGPITVSVEGSRKRVTGNLEFKRTAAAADSFGGPEFKDLGVVIPATARVALSQYYDVVISGFGQRATAHAYIGASNGVVGVRAASGTISLPKLANFYLYFNYVI